MDDNTGFNKVPDRYATDSGREAIDLIRDSMSDAEFVQYCWGTAKKYALRDGKKGPDDGDKRRWYELMADHVTFNTPDPRSNRPGFKPYVRQGLPQRSDMNAALPVLDCGYLRVVETWGGGDCRMPEAGIIEAARQSTAGSFRGWRRDKKLLEYLYTNKHSTPFEFAGMVIEVKAPIFVFRQWHRHRTQSYNEMSARYTPMPDEHYIPTVARIMANSVANKQAGSAKGSDVLTLENARGFQADLREACQESSARYEYALSIGVPKELARLHVHMNRYTQMRAQVSLRNWLGFLLLRMDPHAQWEIQQYAWSVYRKMKVHFPRTTELFIDGAPFDEADEPPSYT